MPRRFFQHRCHDRKLYTINWTPCNACGAQGVYVGWGWSGIEQWGHFNRLYGLPPYGPHRPWVEGLGLAERCPGCGGKGLFDVDHGRAYQICGLCDGVGRVLTCTCEDLQAVQQIAKLIRQHIHDSEPAGDQHSLTERVLDRISDEPLRTAARSLLEARRFIEVVRVLSWQGVLAGVTPPGLRSLADDEEEPPPHWTWEFADLESLDRIPDAPTRELIIRELDRLERLGLLGD